MKSTLIEGSLLLVPFTIFTLGIFAGLNFAQGYGGVATLEMIVGVIVTMLYASAALYLYNSRKS